MTLGRRETKNLIQNKISVMRVKTFFASLLSLALALSFVACEGDQGPIGPAGPTGPQGPQGPAGEAGGDLAQNCIECHNNNQVIASKLYQWENSVHGTGGTNARGNRESCAVCHASQGFIEVAGTGGQATAAPIEEPLPVNCYTCHLIHENYDEGDWALRTDDPVTFWVGEETADLGNSNLCINCHQARVPSNPGLPTPGEGDDDVVNLTNFRYGPHHGSQGVMFTGSSAYEIPGPAEYSNSVHTNLLNNNACVTCHMADLVPAREAGGHTFRVVSEGGELNVNGCTQCHDDDAAFEKLVEDTQSEIAGLLNQLGTRLNELGLLDDDLEYAVTPQEFTNQELGILWNYQYVREDQSFGVHNYRYAKALLENSLAALN